MGKKKEEYVFAGIYIKYVISNALYVYVVTQKYVYALFNFFYLSQKLPHEKSRAISLKNIKVCRTSSPVHNKPSATAVF